MMEHFSELENLSDFVCVPRIFECTPRMTEQYTFYVQRTTRIF
jgi:hypothetical protein